MENPEKVTMTRYIAVTLLIAFAVSILLLFIINFILLKESDEKWFALLKDGLILLGTSLTTVIGYYFGQRTAEQAEKKAIEAEKNLETAKEVVKNYDQQVKDLGSSAPSATSNDPPDLADLTKVRKK